MKNLINFLIRYHAFLLFIVLEFVSVLFIVRYNNFHNVKFVHSSNYLAGSVYSKFQSITDYFQLRTVNNQLATENARLRNELYTYKMTELENVLPPNLYKDQYKTVAAKVINNSVNKQYNYLTLNKGRLQGVKPDMGVICHSGVVGVVVNVSDHFSTVLSVLNSRWNINAKLSTSGHFGPLRWDGQNPYIAILEEIPYHVNVEIGEELVTSGFSSIFPEGILIGRVLKAEHNRGENFQRMQIQLSSDFNNLYHVEIIEDIFKDERLNLENETFDE